MGSVRSLAQAYRRFAEADRPDRSPLYKRIALALSESDEALRAIEAAPARRRNPTVILAALHDLALAGRAPALTAAYAAAAAAASSAAGSEATAADADAAAATGADAGSAAIDTLLRMTDSIADIAAARRPVRADETGRYAVLYPAITEAARRAGAGALGLIDIGCSAGLNLNVDRVGVTYIDGPSLGDPSSPVQRSSSIMHDRPVPTRAMPEVVARIGVDVDPVDVTDPDDAHWLRACLPPDQPERRARLDAEMALAATVPPLLLRGDAAELLPDAIARVPAEVLPIVVTTWALSQFPLETRQRFLRGLEGAAAGRAVAWVSAEGVGVAPTIPTLGDRPASGHSIIGLALFGGPAHLAVAIGRCWSRGRFLEWLADS